MAAPRAIAAPTASGASRTMPSMRERRAAPPTSFASLFDAARRPSFDPAPNPTSRSRTAGSAGLAGRAAAGRSVADARGRATTGTARQTLTGVGASLVDAADAGPWAGLINRAAARNGVDPTLVAAVARAESGLNPRAVSQAGAKGLMQLMDGTARLLGVKDSFDPAQNIEGGARYLGEMLERFGSPELALAAYNAGPNAVDRAGGVPPFKETQTYVRRVLDYQRQMKAERL